MTQPEHVREDLGAYVLGALEPSDRRAVEVHVGSCAACRDELARLSGLPALLDRLTPQEAVSELVQIPDELAPELARRFVAVSGQLRRSVLRWRLAAAGLALVAVVAGGAHLVDTGPALDGVTAQLHPVAADAAVARGVMTAYSWEWGTTVQLEVAGLPARERYVIWAVDRTGARERVGTWGPTADGTALVRSASGTIRDDLGRVEVRDLSGVLLLQARLGDASGPAEGAGATAAGERSR